MSSFEENLSEGNVAKQLVLFSLPFLASNIIQSLYSVADMLIVGRFSGTTSMSGVNLGSQVTLILTNIVVGLCAGGTVLIAQYLGAKRRKDMQETTATFAYDINHCGSCHYRFNAYSQETDSSSDPDTSGILCRG